MNATKKQSWVAIAAVTMATILLGTTTSITAATNSATLTAKQAKALVGTAETPADHRKLAAYYNGEAEKLEVQSRDHDDLADVYKNHPAVLGSKSSVPMSGPAMHCSNLAKSLRDAAKEDRELAVEHEQMAKDAVK